MKEKRTGISILWVAGCLALLPAMTLAESTYMLPMCKIIDERELSDERTELLEHCDVTEGVLTRWFADAPGEGLSDQEAHDRALTYIVTAHWLRLVEIESAGDPVCGDGICGAGETEQSCPVDCSSGGGSTGGGGGSTGGGGAGAGGE